MYVVMQQGAIACLSWAQNYHRYKDNKIASQKQTDYWIFYLPVISKIFEIQNIRELNTTKIKFRYTVT